MTREIITIQVGQCGNQIGAELLRHLAAELPDGGLGPNDSVHFYRAPGGAIRARILAVDMEEGVLSRLAADAALAPFLDELTFLSDASGAGNNWARGFVHYGNMHMDAISEGLRRQAERCDSLQGFMVTHSAGGGTGSGLGSRIVEGLSDLFPRRVRVSGCVLPSESTDDVVTSPYNSVLALSALTRAADLVIPFENERLESLSANASSDMETPFAAMNSLAARALAALSGPARHAGALNVDFTELATNLVPFSGCNIAIPALAPLPAGPAARAYARPGAATAARAACDPATWLADAGGDRPVVHAGAVLASCPARADAVEAAAAAATAARGGGLDWAWWNTEGFKFGASDGPAGALGLWNASCSGRPLARASTRFGRLFKRKLYLHHFTEFMEESEIADRAAAVAETAARYARLSAPSPPNRPKIDAL